MKQDELIALAKESIRKINTEIEKMTTCKSLTERLPGTSVCCLDEDGVLIGLTVLSEEQMERLMKAVLAEVEAAREDTLNELERITNRNTELEPRTVVIPHKPEVLNPKPKLEPRKTIKEEQVRKLYLEEGKTAKEIAAITGFTVSTITTYLSKKGISKKAACIPEQEGLRGDEKRDDKERVSGVDGEETRLEGNTEQIREWYESGKKTLTELSNDYQVSKKAMYQFVEAKHMRKPEKRG